MKNRYSLILIFFGLFLFSITSCDDENEPQNENDLIGVWNYAQVTISSCNNSNNNNIIDYDENGYCVTSPNTITCTKISLEMDETNYIIKTATNTDGVDEIEITEEGTYSISFGSPYSTVMFCTDIVCRTETYIVSGNTLNLESVNPANGCNTIISANKN